MQQCKLMTKQFTAADRYVCFPTYRKKRNTIKLFKQKYIKTNVKKNVFSCHFFFSIDLTVVLLSSSTTIRLTLNYLQNNLMN